VPLFTVLSFFFKTIEEEDLGMRAASMAYNFFMALFPAVIFFFSLIAYIPIENLHEDILKNISNIMPTSAFEAVQSTLNDILKNQHGDLLSFGIISALFFASNAVFNMFKAFNSYDKTADTRSVWRRRLLSLLITVILSLLLVVGVFLIAFGQFALDWLVEKGVLNRDLGFYSLVLVKWVIILALYFMIISFIYYFGSTVRHKWKFITAGNTIAAVGSISATLAFTFYVNHFNSYNKLYGSIGTLLVVLLLIYFNSLIILFGYDLNTSIQKAVAALIKPEEITSDKLKTNS
jgi:membrane protein